MVARAEIIEIKFTLPKKEKKVGDTGLDTTHISSDGGSLKVT